MNEEKTQVDLAALKAGGFIMQKQADLFSIRLRVPIGNITSQQIAELAEISSKYGKGYVHLTTRQGIQIPFVHLRDLDSVVRDLAVVGLEPGSCGPRVRNIVACPGSRECPNGLGDSQGFGKRIDESFFGRVLPRKIKMAVSGCPNSCAKPQENDIGFVAVVEPELDESLCTYCGLCEENCPTGAIFQVGDLPEVDRARCVHCGTCMKICPTEAWKARQQGWTLFLGGKIGKQPRLANVFKEFITEEEGLELVEKVLGVFFQLAQKGERLGSMIDRIGLEQFQEAVYHE